MRSLACLVVMCAACGANDGAILTFTAPEGSTATRIEIVLASTDPEAISTIDNQRSQPGRLDDETVTYYRQRATAGVVTSVGTLHGFTMRIEPMRDMVEDETFIPFVLVYDDADQLTAIGTVNDAAGAPTKVIVREGAIASYDVTVEPVTPEAHLVRCFDDAQRAWTSGVAWRPLTGNQLRLLLPDRGADPDATDATKREPDLDCDLHAAGSDDCDDVRAAFHVGQTETCDGLDTDCDGGTLELVEGCPLATTCGGSSSGVSICSDFGATPTQTACLPEATCGCEAGTAGCTRCIIDFTTSGGSGQTLCAPAVGKVYPDCLNCTAEVVGVTGDWEITLGLTETGPFSSKVIGVPGYYYIRAAYTGGATVGDAPGSSLGDVYIAITTEDRMTAVPIAMLLAQGGTSGCETLPSGDPKMYCGP